MTGATTARRPRPDPADRSLAGLLSDLATGTATLLRKEIHLARAELSQKLGEAAVGMVAIAAGAIIAFAGLLFLLLAAVFGLSLVVPDWAAALIVGGGVTLIGLIALLFGRSRLTARSLAPHRTVQSLRDDVAWAKSQLTR
jgi:uncharacterized membrane protein